MKTKEKFIANGKQFNSYIEIEMYAKEQNLRITNTEYYKHNRVSINLISLNK